MSNTIAIGELTTCEVIESGRFLRLDAKDPSGAPVSLKVSFEQAEGILMTLPHLLRKALYSQTGSSSVRFVFPLGQWAVEQSLGHKCLIVTLKTDDGFDVSFGVPFETSHALAAALKQEAVAAGGCADADANGLCLNGSHLN